MSTKTTTVMTLPTDADPDVTRLNEIHANNVTRHRTTTLEAIEAGEILTRRRALFPKRAPKGQGFGDWVKQNLVYSLRTALLYVKCYEEREYLLANPGQSLRSMLSATTRNKPVELPAPDHTTDDNPTDDQANATEPLNPENEVIVLTPGQEKRAERLANYFGIEIHNARRYVRDTAPKKREQPKTDAPEMAKRTIRVPHDTDDLIHNVARTTNRSYAVVANELFEIGRKRFVRRYDLNVAE